MLSVLIDACRALLSDAEFWLLATLGDWSLEETNRPSFGRYLDSWKGRLPESLLEKARLGINDQLKARIEEQYGGELRVARNRPYADSNLRSDLYLVSTDESRAVHVEVKHVYDCTYGKQYCTVIPADSTKPLDYQVVFFATLPNYWYPSGAWYGKWEKARQTNIVGVKEQYAQLCKFLRPADWPTSPPYCLDLPQGTARLTEECIRSRFRDPRVFQADEPWEFIASSHLKDGQVGFAIWEWGDKAAIT